MDLHSRFFIGKIKQGFHFIEKVSFENDIVSGGIYNSKGNGHGHLLKVIGNFIIIFSGIISLPLRPSNLNLVGFLILYFIFFKNYRDMMLINTLVFIKALVVSLLMATEDQALW